MSTADTNSKRFVTKQSKRDDLNKSSNDAEVLNIPPALSPCSPPSVTNSPTTNTRETPKTSNITATVSSFKLTSNLHAQQAREEAEAREIKDAEIKTEEILSCLNGVWPSHASNGGTLDEDDKVVDLWHLRQLAISRGGLLSATIRKRTWPKLVGANEHILTSSIASLPLQLRRAEDNNESTHIVKNLNDLAESDILMIKRDIHDCIWNIEGEIKSIRRKKDLERQKKRSNLNGSGVVARSDVLSNGKNSQNETASIVSFDSGCSTITAGRITPQLIPESDRAFPRYGVGPSSGAAHSSPHASGTSTPVSGIASPNTAPSMIPLGIQNISIGENSNVPTVITKKRTRSHRKRKEEMTLLFNIITSVLRTVPEEDEGIIDDDECHLYCNDGKEVDDDDTVVADNINKLYYFKGMHNVISPLLITLESPSLASLVFNRLGQSHFRDAMGSTFDNIQAGIRLIFMSVLEKNDKDLYEYIINSGSIADPCVFVLPWVLCWFTSEISSYDIITRLFDCFIASHASFPVYFAVAMLTHPAHKSLIMMTPCEKSALLSVIASLPSSTATEVNGMDIFEDMIEVALNYMRWTPIQDIVALSKLNNSDVVKKSLKLAGFINMLKKPPGWAYKKTTSTDWALIRQAKTIRGLSPSSRTTVKMKMDAKREMLEQVIPGIFAFDMALDASGLSAKVKDSVKNPKKRSKAKFKFAILLSIALIIGVLASTQLSKVSMNPYADSTVQKLERSSSKNIIKTSVTEKHTNIKKFSHTTRQSISPQNDNIKSNVKRDRNVMRNGIASDDESELKSEGKFPNNIDDVGRTSHRIQKNRFVGSIKEISDYLKHDSDLFFMLE